MKLTKEEQTVLDAMKAHGTTYDTVQAHTKYKRSTLRRIMAQLIAKDMVINGSKVGFFRIVIQENEQ